MSESRPDRPLIMTAMALAPIFVYWMVIEFVVSPPFWHHWNHWELTFYYTSMDLVDGFAVHLTSGPGTPAQLLGYLVLKVLGTQPENYPQFLLAVHGLTLASCVAAAWFFQRSVFDSANRFLSIACIWFYFSFGIALTFLQVWTSEALYFPLGLLFVVAFVKMLETLPELNNTRVLIAGLCLGSLVSLKFNFLAWVPAFYLVLFVANFQRSIWIQIRTMLWGSLGFLSAFLVITYPVNDSYEYMVRFLLGMAQTGQIDGQGEKTALTLQGALGNWSAFAIDFWPSILFVLLVVIGFIRFSGSSISPPARALQQFRLTILFTIVSTAFSLALISRLYHERYMLPVGLCGLLMFTVFVRTYSGSFSRNAMRSLVSVSFVFLMLVMAQNIIQSRSDSDQLREKSQRLQAKINEIAIDLAVEEPVIIYGWPIPLPAAAMRHQPFYEEHQRALDELYPNAGYHVPWRSFIRLPAKKEFWDMAVFPASSLALIQRQPIPIVNDVSGASNAGNFDNFEVVDEVDDYIIILPLKGESP